MKRFNICWVHYLTVLLLCAIEHHQAFVSSFSSFFYQCPATFHTNLRKTHSKGASLLSECALCASRSNDAVTTTKTLSQNEPDSRHKIEDPKEQHHTSLPLTNVILRISYDGSRFTGWSAANGKNDQSLQTRKRKRNRRRGGVEEFYDAKLPSGFVRSVEGILKDNLAKLYGDVDPNTRIVVEGCSRTDKGVHATCMIAQVYCLKEAFSIQQRASSQPESANENDNKNGDSNEDATIHHQSVIPGKRIPHPTSPTDDSCFETLPMNGNLSRMAFSFNRMRPPDVQITGIAPTPRMKDGEVFHASLSSKYKTYEYRISTGYLWDPTLRKTVWHVGSSDLDLGKIQQACELLRGRHDFSAFQGAARGLEDKRKRIEQERQKNHDVTASSSSSSTGTVCTLYDLRVDAQNPVNVHEDYYFPGVDPPLQHYNIVVKGDRFLYKMVRFLVGALVAVGYGKLEVDDLERALETGSWDMPGGRRKQFQCAPAHGLTLTHIDYGDELSFDWQPLRDPTAERKHKR